jgi:pimeloyl-ACP methyl ester carboxylesterase
LSGSALHTAADGHPGAVARERVLAGLPVTERRLDAGGVKTAVLEGGAGPPLLLLHGGIPWGGTDWAPVLSRLAESHRVIVPDAPGLGESAAVASLDDETFARWLRALIGLTCAERPILIAHSLFAAVAARYAAAHGDSLARLVVYAAPGIGPYRMPLALRLVAIPLALRPNERTLERFQHFALLDRERTRRRDPAWFDAFSAYALTRARIPHVKQTVRRLTKAETKRTPDHELRRIEIPVALLWGRHDRMTPLPLAEAAAERLGWPLHVVDDAAHVPHIEQPDAFLALLTEALGKRPTTRASATEAVR